MAIDRTTTLSLHNIKLGSIVICARNDPEQGFGWVLPGGKFTQDKQEAIKEAQRLAWLVEGRDYVLPQEPQTEPEDKGRGIVGHYSRGRVQNKSSKGVTA